MAIKGNLIKGWITSLIGVVTMLLTLFLVYNGTFDFLWEGVAGLSIGCVLLIAPQTIERSFGKLVEKYTGDDSKAAAADPTTEKPVEQIPN